MKLGLHPKDSPAVAALLRLAMNELLQPGPAYCRRPAVAGAYVRALPNELIPPLITIVVDRVGDDGKRAAALTELVLRIRAAKGTFGEDSAVAQIVQEIFTLTGADVGTGVRVKPPGWKDDGHAYVLQALRDTLPDDLKQALRSPDDSLGFIQSRYPEVYRLLMAGNASADDEVETMD
jgi:hypothetical protein